jgi:hypothetical protein
MTVSRVQGMRTASQTVPAALFAFGHVRVAARVAEGSRYRLWPFDSHEPRAVLMNDSASDLEAGPKDAVKCDDFLPGLVRWRVVRPFLIRARVFVTSEIVGCGTGNHFLLHRCGERGYPDGFQQHEHVGLQLHELGLPSAS